MVLIIAATVSDSAASADAYIAGRSISVPGGPVNTAAAEDSSATAAQLAALTDASQDSFLRAADAFSFTSESTDFFDVDDSESGMPQHI